MIKIVEWTKLCQFGLLLFPIMLVLEKLPIIPKIFQHNLSSPSPKAFMYRKQLMAISAHWETQMDIHISTMAMIIILMTQVIIWSSEHIKKQFIMLDIV